MFELKSSPALNHFRLDASAHNAHLLCWFVLMQNLQSLNSSAIRARSRIEAEKFYLLEICKSLPSSAISSASSAIAAVDTALHPRFSELVSQHGLPIAASDAASVTLAASLAEVVPAFHF